MSKKGRTRRKKPLLSNVTITTVGAIIISVIQACLPGTIGPRRPVPTPTPIPNNNNTNTNVVCINGRSVDSSEPKDKTKEQKQPALGYPPKVRYVVKSKNNKIDEVFDVDETLFHDTLLNGLTNAAPLESKSHRKEEGNVRFNVNYSSLEPPLGFSLSKEQWKELISSHLSALQVTKEEIVRLLTADSVSIQWLDAHGNKLDKKIDFQTEYLLKKGTKDL